MARAGLVLEIKGKHATVSTSLRGFCSGCNEKSSCSFGGDSVNERSEMIRVGNPVQAQPGDYVEFDLTGHTELRVSILVWVVPLLGLVTGAFWGTSFNEQFSLSQDTGTLLGSTIGFIIAFCLIVIYERIFANQRKLTPLISKILQRQTCSESPTAH